MAVNQHGIDRFLALARRGALSHASAVEERACRLLDALLEHSAGLDQGALESAADFVQLMALDYTLAMKLAAPNGRCHSRRSLRRH